MTDAATIRRGESAADFLKRRAVQACRKVHWQRRNSIAYSFMLGMSIAELAASYALREDVIEAVLRDRLVRR